MNDVSDIEFARTHAPVLMQQVVHDWDIPRAIGFGDPIIADPPPLYWWVRELTDWRFVGYCVWYDNDKDHKYDFTGFGYFIPRGDAQPYTWCRRHWNIEISLGRIEPIYSDSGKHSMSTKPLEAVTAIREWDLSPNTNLASQSFQRAAEALQEYMGDSAQLPMNWVDTDVKNWCHRFHRRAHLEYGVDDTRGLIFYRPWVVLDILLRLGKVRT